MNKPPDRGSNDKPPITFDKNKTMSILSTGPKYLVMARVNSEKTLAEVSPFLIKKVIDNTCGGEVESCKKLMNGTILIKTKNFIQAKNLIQLTSMSPTIEVELTEHQSLNFAKGVIYSNDLRGITEEEILKELQTQNVCKIDKILKKTNNELKETGLIIVTFASTTLPSELSIGYEKVRIRPYIPLPLKCKNCLRFGHLSKFCNSKRICLNCSNEFHLDEEKDETCSHPQSCLNCKENNIQNNKHSPNDRSCPIFLKEKEIQAIITLEKTNRKNAIKKYNDRQLSTLTTFSTTIKNVNNTPTTSNSTATTTKETVNQLKPSNTSATSKTYLPPSKNLTTRAISDYSDVLSEMETSDIDSTSSQTKTDKKTIILPKNSSKRTRKQLQKLTKVENETKRTKNA